MAGTSPAHDGGGGACRRSAEYASYSAPRACEVGEIPGRRHPDRHGRPCAGHPRISRLFGWLNARSERSGPEGNPWMAGTSPAMTEEGGVCRRRCRCAGAEVQSRLTQVMPRLDRREWELCRRLRRPVGRNSEGIGPPGGQRASVEYASARRAQSPSGKSQMEPHPSATQRYFTPTAVRVSLLHCGQAVFVEGADIGSFRSLTSRWKSKTDPGSGRSTL